MFRTISSRSGHDCTTSGTVVIYILSENKGNALIPQYSLSSFDLVTADSQYGYRKALIRTVTLE